MKTLELLLFVSLDKGKQHHPIDSPIWVIGDGKVLRNTTRVKLQKA